MLQDIRIVRGTRGSSEAGIPLSEWLEVLSSDPELDPIEFIMGRNPRTGSSVKVLLKGGARWNCHPDSEALPFFWEFDEVVAHSADEQTVAKAQQLAHRMSAECQLSID